MISSNKNRQHHVSSNSVASGGTNSGSNNQQFNGGNGQSNLGRGRSNGRGRGRSNLQCQFCNKIGHVASSFYALKNLFVSYV